MQKILSVKEETNIESIGKELRPTFAQDFKFGVRKRLTRVVDQLDNVDVNVFSNCNKNPPF